MNRWGRKIFHFLFAHGWRKIIALVLAVIIYATIYGMKQSTTVVQDIILEISAEDGLILDPATNQKQVKVSIMVSGDPNLLATLKPTDFEAKVSVRESDFSSDGVYKVNVSPADISFRGNARLNVVKVRDNSVVFINAQRRIRQGVALDWKISGKLSKDYQWGNISCEPVQLYFEGAEKALQNLRVTPLEIALTPEITQSFEKTLNVTVMHGDESVYLVSADGQTRKADSVPVKVTVEILPADALEETISGVEIRIKPDPSSKYIVKSDVKTVELVVKGAPSKIDLLLKNLNNIEVFPDVSAVADKRGTHSVPLKYSLPVDVKVQKITPERVNVTISEGR